MLPGLKAIPAFNGAGSTGAGGGGSLSFTLIASANSSASTITVPASAIAGDWAILFDAALQGGSSISAVTPSGWTNLANAFAVNGYSVRLMTSHRILTAGMAGSTITGMNSDSAVNRKVMLVFRPSTSIVSATASTWNSEVTSGDPASQTVSASGVTTPLIVAAVGAAQSGSAPTFSTETPAMTNITKTGSYLSLRIGYTIYNSSPSDQSIDIGGADTLDGLQSGYVRFT